jgi:hypothetical protein
MIIYDNNLCTAQIISMYEKAISTRSWVEKDWIIYHI